MREVRSRDCFVIFDILNKPTYTFKTAKDNESVLEPFVFGEVNKFYGLDVLVGACTTGTTCHTQGSLLPQITVISDFEVVRGGSFAILLVFGCEWTIFEYFSEGVGNPHLVAPVHSQLLKRLTLTHHLASVELLAGRQLLIVQADGHAGVLLKLKIDLARLLTQANIYPATLVVFHRPLDHAPLAVLAPLALPQVVRRIQRIHEAGESEGGRPREQGLSQVLGRFEVLEVLHEEFRGGQILQHALHLVLRVVADNDDFVDIEHRGSLGDLTHQVRFELHGLGVVNDGCRHSYRNSKSSPGLQINIPINQSPRTTSTHPTTSLLLPRTLTPPPPLPLLFLFLFFFLLFLLVFFLNGFFHRFLDREFIFIIIALRFT